MQGLDISRQFYLTYGKKMLEEFDKDRLAVGLAGEGSECLRFDDEISRDHDFDAGFCIWITKEDEEKFGFPLSRAYSKLPKEFMGLTRSLLSPVGGNRHGVIAIEDFYIRFLGAPTAPDTIERWLYTPSFSLLSACNGEVFEDNLGEFSKIRNQLLKGYPEDIRKKKLAGHTLLMAQAGQYNYPRLIKRNEGSAQLAVFEFVKHAISVIYLLNNRYEPFYKWAFRGMKSLPVLGSLADALQGLCELDNNEKTAKTKCEIIEDISSLITEQFKLQNLSDLNSTDLERHAYLIQNTISDNILRTMHILTGI